MALTPRKKMATKIEGVYAKKPVLGTYVFYPEATPASGFPASTLIIHDGPPERCYTESEVRAYAEDLLMARISPGQVVERGDHGDEPLYKWIDRAIESVNEKHGIKPL